MKKQLFWILWLLLPSAALAQHRALYSQYMFNRVALNPGAAGVDNGVNIHLSLRQQWVGIEEAPVTQLLAADSYVGLNTSLGGYLFNEVTGPTRRTGVAFGGAYQLYFRGPSWRRTDRRTYPSRPENERILSFGLFGMIYQQSLAYDQLTTEIPGDVALQPGAFNQILPDINFGIYYRDRDRWYAGFSVLHLVQARPYAGQSGPVRTYYLNGGVRFGDRDRMVIEPSFLLQSIEAFWTLRQVHPTRVLPFQVDLNLRAIWQEVFWAGVSYRHRDALVGMIGITQPTFRLGYSYDYTLSDIRGFSQGSHELAVTLILTEEL